MKILLAAGVQCNGRVLKDRPYQIGELVTPLEYAIENRQDEAILLLLDTDSVTNLRNALGTVMQYKYEPSSRIVSATIEAMVRIWDRLRNLAIAHLSHRELDHLRISHKDQPVQMLDGYATPTADALKNVGIQVSEALEPGWSGATVYHHLWYAWRGDPSVEFADRLWSSGF